MFHALKVVGEIVAYGVLAVVVIAIGGACFVVYQIAAASNRGENPFR